MGRSAKDLASYIEASRHASAPGCLLLYLQRNSRTSRRRAQSRCLDWQSWGLSFSLL